MVTPDKDFGQLVNDRSFIYKRFAAETQDVIANAVRKLREKGLDLIVANDVADARTAFAVDTNAVTIIDAAGRQESVPLMTKAEVADRVLERALACRRGAPSGNA